MKSRLYNSLNNPLYKNIIRLTSGSAGVQIINFLCYPVISRLYGPSDFGLYSIFLSLFSIIDVASALKLEVAIPLPKSRQISIYIAVAALNIILIYGTLVFIAFLLIPDAWYVSWNIGSPSIFKYLLPAAIVFGGIYKLLLFLNIREKEFKRVTVSLISQSLMKNITQLTLGFAGYPSRGLIIGHMVNLCSGGGVLLKKYIREVKQGLSFISYYRIKTLLYRYRRFPLYAAPSSLINSVGLYLPVIFINYLYDSHVAGLYAFSVTVVATPFRVLGQSISNVFLSEFAEKFRTKSPEVKTLYYSILKRLLIVGLIPVIIIFCFGEPLFRILFGVKWEQSGFYTQFLVFSYYGQFCTAPLSQVLNILQKQNLQLLWDVSRLCSILIFFYLAAFFKLSSINTIILLSGIICLTYLFLGVLCYRSVKTVKV